MSPDIQRKYRWPLLLGGVVIVLLTIYGIYTAISRAGKEPVAVHSIPADATVTVNGQPISPGTAYLPPGKYTIEASRGGFTSYKDEIVVGQPNKNDIDIALVGVSDSAKEWQEKNQKLYLEREGRGGKRAAAKGEAFREANPITAQLPYKNLIYSVGYHLDPEDSSNRSIILDVTAGRGYWSGALQKIRELGYDPSDFSINFTNHQDPFTQ
jgi:hypothetical protein